jgi:hypothetical protein
VPTHYWRMLRVLRLLQTGTAPMITPSDFMFTLSDLAKIARTPEVMLTVAFGVITFAYFLAASGLA